MNDDDNNNNNNFFINFIIPWTYKSIRGHSINDKTSTTELTSYPSTSSHFNSAKVLLLLYCNR